MSENWKVAKAKETYSIYIFPLSMDIYGTVFFKFSESEEEEEVETEVVEKEAEEEEEEAEEEEEEEEEDEQATEEEEDEEEGREEGNMAKRRKASFSDQKPSWKIDPQTIMESATQN